MKKALLVLSAFLALANTGLANSLCSAGASLDLYIATYMGFSNACQIGDKVFYNFGYSASSTPAGNQPSASETVVIPDPGDGFTNPGLVFSVGGFLAFPGESMDATITYTIATLSGSALIEDYSLTMSGSHTFGGLGFGSVTESFTNSPVGSPLITSVGPGTSGNLSAHVDFLPWVSGTTVTTNIHLESPHSGIFDVVMITTIQEHFSEAVPEVPEPYETLLISSGLLVFGLFRKRRSNS